MHTFPSIHFKFAKKIVFGNLQKFDKSKSENLIWLPTLNLTNKFVINHIASKSNEIPIVFTNKRLQNFLSKYIFQTHEKWFLSIFKNLTRVSQRIWLTLTLNLTNKFIINHITSKSNDIPIVSTDKRLHNFLSNYNNFGRFFA